MVVRDFQPSALVYDKGEAFCAVRRNFLCNMYREIILLNCIEYLDGLAVLGNNDASVPDLATHLGIERSTLEH